MFLYGYAVVSVKVNTTDCDSVNMGSIPILLPNFCPGDGIGIRVGLRSQILRVRVSP